MKVFAKLLSTTFLFLVFLLCAPSLPHVFAQSATSPCVKTIVGQPDPNQKLPGGCGAGGGNQKAVELARSQIGDPYVWGAPARNWAAAGDNPPSFDCSGLVGWAWFKATDGAFKMAGQTSADWNGGGSKYQKFTPADIDQMQPGDLVYFGNPVHHVGMFAGDDIFIEAQQTGVPVKETKLSSRKDWVGFLRPNVQ